jgi:hypothetical protein
MKKETATKPPVQERFHVYAKIKHNDGEIEPRRLYLENFARFGDAAMAAYQAKQDPHVLAAWVEPSPNNGGTKQ